MRPRRRTTAQRGGLQRYLGANEQVLLVTRQHPFALLRAPKLPHGLHRLILWSIGGDRVAAMRALREVTACGLEEARGMLEGLPREFLVDVTERYADQAATVLRAAGCDVEVVAPRR